MWGATSQDSVRKPQLLKRDESQSGESYLYFPLSKPNALLQGQTSSQPPWRELDHPFYKTSLFFLKRFACFDQGIHFSKRGTTLTSPEHFYSVSLYHECRCQPQYCCWPQDACSTHARWFVRSTPCPKHPVLALLKACCLSCICAVVPGLKMSRTENQTVHLSVHWRTYRMDTCSVTCRLTGFAESLWADPGHHTRCAGVRDAGVWAVRAAGNASRVGEAPLDVAVHWEGVPALLHSAAGGLFEGVLGEQGELSGRVTLMVQRSWVQTGEFSSPVFLGSSPGRKIFFTIVNFLRWLLFCYLFHPRVTAVARERSWSFCQKRWWQVAANHTCFLRMWLWIKWHCKLVHGCVLSTESAPRWQQFHMAPAMQQLKQPVL